MSSIILIHLLTTFLMLGVIWTVQLLHYPSFEFFHEEHFTTKMQWHQRQVSWIVIPAMLIELGTGAWICWMGSFYDRIWNINLGLIVLIWLSTMIYQGPIHGKLARQRASEDIKRLVQTNWIRTALWSLRAMILLYYLI